MIGLRNPCTVYQSDPGSAQLPSTSDVFLVEFFRGSHFGYLLRSRITSPKIWFHTMERAI